MTISMKADRQPSIDKYRVTENVILYILKNKNITSKSKQK